METIKLYFLLVITYFFVACEQQSSDKDRLTVTQLEQEALFLNDFVSSNYSIGDSVCFISENDENKYFVVQDVGQGVIIIEGAELEDKNDHYKKNNPYYNKTTFHQSYVRLKNEISLDNFIIFLVMDDLEKISLSVNYNGSDRKFKLNIDENVDLIQCCLDTDCLLELERNVGIVKITDNGGRKWILKEHKRNIN